MSTPWGKILTRTGLSWVPVQGTLGMLILSTCSGVPNMATASASHPHGLGRRTAGRDGIALSHAPLPGTEGVGTGGVETDGEQAAREVLPNHGAEQETVAFRPQSPAGHGSGLLRGFGNVALVEDVTRDGPISTFTASPAGMTAPIPPVR